MAPRRKPLMTTIDTSGPFFTHDPSKTFRGNARSMLRQMAFEGARDIRAQLITGQSGRAIIQNGRGRGAIQPPRVSGHVAAGVPYTPTEGKASRGGPIIVHVYVPNFGYTPKQGRALMAAYSEVEHQTGAFKRTTTRLRRSRAVNNAELAKGLT